MVTVFDAPFARIAMRAPPFPMFRTESARPNGLAAILDGTYMLGISHFDLSSGCLGQGWLGDAITKSAR
jgi:hypothetical protein